MADIVRGRHTAEIDGDFVVFLIGARISLRHPIRALGDLGGRRGGMVAMLDHLEAFARDGSDPHAKTWREYYRRQSRHGQGAGIWHETYLVRAGEYEAVYNNMPASGLGQAGRLVPMAESSTARLRLRVRDDS